METVVIASKEGRSGRVTLNGNSAQHRLNLAVCQQVFSALQKWITDEDIDLIIIDHADGKRGFCAGGDVVTLASLECAFSGAVESYLSSLYRLCCLISRYPKPVVTFLDGAVKSSGVGLAMNGTYRIATERTVVSFPDTAYGFIPDAGATKFLSSLPNELGTWLALTGARLSGSQAVSAGLATHYCDSNETKRLKAALQNEGIDALAGQPTSSSPSLIERFGETNELFSADCANELKYRLDSSTAWGKTQGTKIGAKSPLSTKIALRLIRTGKYLDSVEEALRLEYRVATRLMKTKNFREGVRAILIDMDYCPRWKPRSLTGVSYDLVSQFFSPNGIDGLSFEGLPRKQSKALPPIISKPKCRYVDQQAPDFLSMF